MTAADQRPYIIRTYDRWIIFVIVLVAGWLLFRPIFGFTIYYRGLSFERMLQLQTAEHYYKKSTVVYPRLPEGWIGLGELYYMWTPAQPQYYAKGIAVLKEAASFNPHNAKLAFDLGRFYFRAHDYRRALPAFLRSASDDPASVFAWDFAAWSCVHMGQRERALRYWHEVLKLEPTNAAVLRAVKTYGS